MALIDDLVAWYEKERADLQQQAEMLESGGLRLGERRPGTDWTDVTTESLHRIKRQLGDIEALLDRCIHDAERSE